MSDKGSGGFVTGLIVEGAVIGLVVTLLPKVPLGNSPAPREQIADRRPTLQGPSLQGPSLQGPSLQGPSLAPAQVAPERLPPPFTNWRTAVSRPAPREAAPVELPPPDPAYVERRLDEAGEQLLSGVTTYLSRQAQEVLQTPLPAQPQQIRSAPLPPSYTAPSFTPPQNAFRY